MIQTGMAVVEIQMELSTQMEKHPKRQLPMWNSQAVLWEKSPNAVVRATLPLKCLSPNSQRGRSSIYMLTVGI